MRKLRVHRPRRGVLWLAVPVLALLAAVFLVPGIARAGTPVPVPALPTPPGGGPIGGLVGGLTGSPSPPAASTPADPVAGQQPSQPDTTTSAQSGLPAPPSLDPSQLDALFQALGIPAGCSAAVQQDLQQLVGDIPTTIQQIVDEIVSQLPTGGGLPSSPLTLTDPQSGGTILLKELTSPGGTPAPTFSSPDPSELPVVKDLQQLVTDLQQKCAPASPGSPPSAPSPPAGGGQQAPPPAQGVSQPQPVSYPGYAPTGSIATDAGTTQHGGEAPLAALAGVLVVVSGAAVTVTRLRTRAARETG